MADNLALANALLAHDKATGAVCGMVWRSLGVSSPIGQKLDRSAWNGLDLLAHSLHRDSEAKSPSALAAAAVEHGKAMGRSDRTLTPAARWVCLAWVDELLRQLAEVDEVLGEEPFSVRVRPPRQLKTWAAVRDALAAGVQ